MIEESTIWIGAAIATSLLSVSVAKAAWDARSATRNSDEVAKAEKVVFEADFTLGDSSDNSTANDDPDSDQPAVRKRSIGIPTTAPTDQAIPPRLVLGRLINLYSKQIEKYQQETRARASWSFMFAIASMFFGMGLVFWGGAYVLSESGADHVAAGGTISAK